MALNDVKDRAIQVIEQAHEQFAAGVLDNKRNGPGSTNATSEFYLDKFIDLINQSSNEESVLVNLLRVLRPGFGNGGRSWARIGSIFNVTCAEGRITGHVGNVHPEQIIHDLETLRGRSANYKKANHRMRDEILNRMGDFAPRLPEQRAKLGRLADQLKDGLMFNDYSPKDPPPQPKEERSDSKTKPGKTYSDVASGEAPELDAHLAQLRGFFSNSDNVMPEIVASLAELLRGNQPAHKELFQLVRNPYVLAGKLIGLRSSESMYRMFENGFEHLEGDATLKEAPIECVTAYANMLASALTKVVPPKTLHSFSVPKAKKPGSALAATPIINHFSAYITQLSALEPAELADVIANSIQTGSKLVPALVSIHSALSTIVATIPDSSAPQ